MRRPGHAAARAALTLCVVVAGHLAGHAAGFAPAPAFAARSAPGRVVQTQAPPPAASIVVDAATGTVLSATNAHEARPPASTAKVMTAVTAVERLPADALVAVSAIAAAQPASRIGMLEGQQWPLEHALASLMLSSANDAAYALAETAGGSLDGFATAMAATGERLGMRDSTFSDPAGFDDEASFAGGPRMSAFDIAIATRNALTVPPIATLASTRVYEFTDPAGTPRSLTNHNKLLPGSSRGYAGATGFKTGYTDQAGHTLVATATRDGRTLIAVVLNTWDTYAWAATLLDQGFATANDAGTGERLPAVAVSSYEQRVEDRDGFVALARGRSAALASAARAADASTTTAAVPTTLAPTPLRAGSGGTDAAAEDAGAAVEDGAAAATPAAGDGGGLVNTRNVVLAGVTLLAGLVVLRRRAVRRQRARRLARRRAWAAQMRSGSLPVVDGRYRTRTRIGPPVESHVRVHHTEERR